MKTLKLKPISRILIVLAVIGGAIFLFTSRDKTPDAQETATKPALTVTTARPAPARLPIMLAANGNIAAWQEAIIGSESNGLRLTEVRVNVGDNVRAGQTLATFAADTIDADVAQARAGLNEARANAADAAANAERARSLQSTGALSAQQINQYLTAEQTAKARVAASEATLAMQKLRLKHTRLLAPDSGIISSRSATVGAVVGTGTELFRMIRQGRLEWRAEVTAAELARLRPGTAARVTVANGTQIKGRVRMIAPTVDPLTRSALVYVDLPAVSIKNAAAKAGMFAKGVFDMGASSSMTLPQQAVVLRDGFSYVFRLSADQHVTQVRIETGRRIGDRVEVRSGLPADAVVVVTGAGFLNDGDLVRVAEIPDQSARARSGRHALRTAAR